MHSSNWLTTLYFYDCYLLACNMVTVRTNYYYYELTHGIPLGPQVLLITFMHISLYYQIFKGGNVTIFSCFHQLFHFLL